MINSYIEPFEDECLVSYVNRLVNDFGYDESEFFIYFGTRLIFGRMIMHSFTSARVSYLPSIFDGLDVHRLMSPEFRITKILGKIIYGGAGSMHWRNFDAYCPECLSEKMYWRLNWLQPHAMVCPRHRILLNHVCQCGHTLFGEKARKPIRYNCYACDMPLHDGPRIPASLSLVHFQKTLDERYDEWMTVKDRASAMLSSRKIVAYKKLIIDVSIGNVKHQNSYEKAWELFGFTSLMDDRNIQIPLNIATAAVYFDSLEKSLML